MTVFYLCVTTLPPIVDLFTEDMLMLLNTEIYLMPDFCLGS